MEKLQICILFCLYSISISSVTSTKHDLKMRSPTSDLIRFSYFVRKLELVFDFAYSSYNNMYNTTILKVQQTLDYYLLLHNDAKSLAELKSVFMELNQREKDLNEEIFRRAAIYSDFAPPVLSDIEQLKQLWQTFMTQPLANEILSFISTFSGDTKQMRELLQTALSGLIKERQDINDRFVFLKATLEDMLYQSRSNYHVNPHLVGIANGLTGSATSAT